MDRSSPPMSTPAEALIYDGDVVHARLRPRRHRLVYRVFALALDVDRIAAIARRSRILTHNRPGLVAFYDADHGDGSSRSVAETARDALAAAGLADAGDRIVLLTYPRILGYVFNPLSVYFCHDARGRLAALIYEVTNTYRERMSYVVAAGAPVGNVHAHACAKELYVSPFAPAAVRYGFRVRRDDTGLLVGVHLHDQAGALLRTHFAATAKPLDDTALALALLRRPLMTLKVIAAIHYEAAKLYFKGVPVVRRHASPRYSLAGRAAADKVSSVSRP